jgi:peptidoglycan/LPS O-acetylase OafA/YrhL
MTTMTQTTKAPPTLNAPHRLNNFDTMRIIAALTVVLAHSIPLSEGPTSLDALWTWSHGQATFGYVAIQVFFIISGYLITGSYLNSARADQGVAAKPRLIDSRGARRFMRARLLRLAPALLVVLWLLAFIVGPILTSVPLATYFSSPLTYRLAMGMSDHLPGMFTHNPFSSGIDGSLWTLRYEGLCYVVVLALGLVRLLTRWVVTALFVIILIARLHFGAYAGLDLGTLFAAGAVIRLWNPPLTIGLAVPALLACLAGLYLGFYHLASFTLGAYLVIFIGLAPVVRLPNLARYGDISYGVYIIAWPVQQIIVLLTGAHPNWIVNNLITVPLVIGLSFLSWRLIEAPALKLKNHKLFNVL